jgi:hypothetical protein
MDKRLIAGIAVASLVAVFLGGRWTAPATTVVDVQEKLVYQDRVQIVEVKVKEQAQTKVVERVKVVAVDGSSHETETERTDMVVSEWSGNDLIREIQGNVSTTAHVEDRDGGSRFYGGVMVVVDPGSLRLEAIAGSMSIGLMGGLRLIGPLSVGATATVPVARPLSWPTLGLNLSVSW